MQWLALILLVVGFAVFFARRVWPMHVRRKRQLDHAENLFSNRTSIASVDFASLGTSVMAFCMLISAIGGGSATHTG